MAFPASCAYRFLSYLIMRQVLRRDLFILAYELSQACISLSHKPLFNAFTSLNRCDNLFISLSRALTCSCFSHELSQTRISLAQGFCSCVTFSIAQSFSAAPRNAISSQGQLLSRASSLLRLSLVTRSPLSRRTVKSAVQITGHLTHILSDLCLFYRAYLSKDQPSSAPSLRLTAHKRPLFSTQEITTQSSATITIAIASPALLKLKLSHLKCPLTIWTC